MEKIRVILNRESNTLDVWFDDPEKEFISLKNLIFLQTE